MPHPTTGEPIPLKRNYLSPRGDSVIELSEGSEQKERRQVFGFVLAGESRLRRDSLVATFRAGAAGMEESLVPNLLVTLAWGTSSTGARSVGGSGGKYASPNAAPMG